MSKTITEKKNELRAQLLEIMPGYKWTVHKDSFDKYDIIKIEATGVQSSGSNRTSTLQVTLDERAGKVGYLAKSSGHGKNAPWLEEFQAPTLAQALRGLQQRYEYSASLYAGHARALQEGRVAAPKEGGAQ
jgi:hypothetical protein